MVDSWEYEFQRARHEDCLRIAAQQRQVAAARGYAGLFRGKRENALRRLLRPIHPLYVVGRFLAPWAVVLVMSTAIAKAADAGLVRSNGRVVVTEDEAQLQAHVAREAEGVLTRVECPGDTDLAEHKVLITSLQDVQALEEGLCKMRS